MERSKRDWSEVDGLTDEQREANVRDDPDAVVLTAERLARFRRVPLAKFVRRKLGISQAVFAVRYGIPVGTLRDWERGRVVPDAAATSLLKIIAAEPDRAAKALEQV